MVQKGAIITTLPAAERERWIRGLPNLAQDLGGHSGPASRDVLNAYFAAIRAAGQTPGRNWDREADRLTRAPDIRSAAMADEIDMAALDAAAAPRPFDPVRLLLDALAAIGTIWTFGLMLLICADVIGRSFLNAPITGVAEIAAHSVVGIVFLQIGATIYNRRMTRADFLIEGILRAAPASAGPSRRCSC
jgi:hypothetical protein